VYVRSLFSPANSNALTFLDPYDSFTWFEASILRPMDIHQPLPRSPTNLSNSIDASTLHQLGWAEISNPHDERNRRWRVQANATLLHPQVHQVTWVRTYQVGNITLEDEFDARTGKGSGFGFVESLKSGDRIALVGRALVSRRSYSMHLNLIKVFLV
jgi:hypothetical protein